MTDIMANGILEPDDSLLGQWVALPGQADPYPIYHALRATSPVYFDRDFEAYFLVRYADVDRLLNGPGFIVGEAAARGHVEVPAQRFDHRMIPIGEPPSRVWLGALLDKGFAPWRLEAERANIDHAVTRVLDRLEEQGAGGAVADFHQIVGSTLPLWVICGLLGVPRSDQEALRPLVIDLIQLFDPDVDGQTRDRATTGMGTLREYFAELLQWRRKRLSGDLVSALVVLSEEDKRLTCDGLLDVVLLLFTAGFESTVSLLSGAAHGLLSHQEQADLLRRDGACARAVFDEALRWDSPAQTVLRFASTEVGFGDVIVPPGTPVVGMLGAANRDPDRFADPDRFDIQRSGNLPLSLGGGPRFCRGAKLARLQTDVLFSRLFHRFPGLAPAGSPVRRLTPAVRGFASLPVTI